MFTITKKSLFWWPVIVKIPSPDSPGVYQEHEFEMQFEAMALDRARAIDEERRGLPADEREARAFDFLFDVARGWRDVVAEDGTAVPFSREVFEAQLQYPWFRDGVLSAYARAVTGQGARLGN
ncbi:hypothetical protein ACSD7O_22205 [Methylorubrum extorquens]|uniref:hypothetical protein n=1 Tax=Methylorubrum extorquens TaxID=408 RepID=UPI003F5FD668